MDALDAAKKLLRVSGKSGPNGFDVSRHSIPVKQILGGGPQRDGIPALMNPKFIGAREADNGWLKDADRVMGLFLGGEAKAYPIKILNWHEIVNDTVGGRAVAVTFCPLCGTGMVFDGAIEGREYSFGVSGLLYQSDMLLYDHQTESLWSQIKSEAVAGPMMGARLKLVASVQTTWGQWKAKHPKTLALSDKTGYRRNYERDPYRGYDSNPFLMFEVNHKNAALRLKDKVLGIELGKVVRAYPFLELEKASSPLSDIIGGVPVKVYFDKESQTALIKDSKGEELPTLVGFWFAWFTFHPETEIFRTGQSIERAEMRE